MLHDRILKTIKKNISYHIVSRVAPDLAGFGIADPAGAGAGAECF